MFREKDKRRGPGRPPGRTAQGEETREHLYSVAIRLFGEQGFEGTTLRAIAREADVSPGLMYRYFPSKAALVLELYARLSRDFAAGVALPEAGWAARGLHALRASLTTLTPHRDALRALTGVLVADPDSGLFSKATAFSRERVMGVFVDAVSGASDAPSAALASALGRLLYLLHLGVILWWLLDRSPAQRATAGLIALLGAWRTPATAALWLPGMGAALRQLDALVVDGLLEPAEAGPTNP